MDVGLEEGLRASLAMLALEMVLLDTILDNVDVLAVAASTAYDISTMLSSLHEALQRTDAAEWTEAIC